MARPADAVVFATDHQVGPRPIKPPSPRPAAPFEWKLGDEPEAEP